MNYIPKLLFAIFVFSSSIWLLKQIFPSIRLKIRFMLFNTIGVSIYSIYSFSILFVKSILLYFASPYLYFKGFYYYGSIAASILTFIFLTILILGAISLHYSDKDNSQKQELTDSKKNELLNKLKDGMFFGILNRITLTVAWTKTFKFINLNISSNIETIIILILYTLVFFHLITVILKTIKNNKTNQLRTS